MKLKNYSSGMLVRLGFSLMTQVDADVLLIDEVLAVGDASFQQKCFDAFARLHAEGKTIILVTHDMPAVEAHCDRAILLENGLIDRAGDPAEVARRYLELNFPDDRHQVVPRGCGGRGRGRTGSGCSMSTLRDEQGLAVGELRAGRARSGSRSSLEVLDTARFEPARASRSSTATGCCCSRPQPLPLGDGSALEAGDRVSVQRSDLATRSPPATTTSTAPSSHGPDEPRPVAFRKNAADFVVFGTRPFGGVCRARLRGRGHRRRR